MCKRNFIKLKRGILDAEHVSAIGSAIWLFIYILDKTDWDNGIFQGYTDADAAEAIGKPKRTIRSWRTRLEDGQYIACRQSLHSQIVYVNNWSNPKKKWNNKSSDEYPLENWSGPQIQKFVIDTVGLFVNLDIARLGNVKKALLEFGEDKTKNAILEAYTGWGNQKRKDNGKKYSLYNLGWIDWAIEYLITNEKRWQDKSETSEPRIEKVVNPFTNEIEEVEVT